MTKTEAIRRLHYMKEPGRDKDNEALELAIRALHVSEPGTWVQIGTARFKCTRCGGESMKWTKFCPHCGKEMVYDL